MKNKLIKLTLTAGLIIIAFTGTVLAQQLSKGGLIADIKANKVGDIVTIIISENASASNITSTQTSKSNDMSMTGAFGANSFLSALTGTVTANTSNDFDGSGTVTSQGTLTLNLTATIQEIREDGNFLIRGTREVNTNGEKVVTVVEGVIRPSDVTSNNTINSSLIADAKIFHQGKGVATEARRPGLLTRIINWIF